MNSHLTGSKRASPKLCQTHAMERIFAPGASPDPARADSSADGEYGEEEQRCGRRGV